jgi:hypothetical protein
MVDLLVPACSAASRRLKVVMCPVERVWPRCARLGCKVFCGSLPRASCHRSSGGSTVLMQTLDPYLAAREALFRNLSDEAARAWWRSEAYAPPAHPTVPLATVRKARLQWLDATDDMLAESRVPVRPRLRRPPHPHLHVEEPGRRAGKARPAAAQWSACRSDPSASAHINRFEATAKAGRWHIRRGTPRPKKRGSP